jgi:hypothetical protein
MYTSRAHRQREACNERRVSEVGAESGWCRRQRTFVVSPHNWARRGSQRHRSVVRNYGYGYLRPL